MTNSDEILKHFARSHGRELDRELHGGPLWHTGSDVAALFAIRWHLEPLISNGAWPSVYYNNVGWVVPIAARGYRLLGMSECADRCDLAIELVRAAEASHPGHDYSSQEWLSSTLMEAISETDWDKLDDGWFELTAGPEGTIERMAAYVRAHFPAIEIGQEEAKQHCLPVQSSQVPSTARQLYLPGMEEPEEGAPR